MRMSNRNSPRPVQQRRVLGGVTAWRQAVEASMGAAPFFLSGLARRRRAQKAWR